MLCVCIRLRARTLYIICVLRELLEGKKGQKCIEKTSLFFEHKGTRIFLTRKPLIKKKHHTHYFLNYTLFLANKTLVFLDKPPCHRFDIIINVLILCVLAGFDPQSHPLFI